MLDNQVAVRTLNKRGRRIFSFNSRPCFVGRLILVECFHDPPLLKSYYDSQSTGLKSLSTGICVKVHHEKLGLEIYALDIQGGFYFPFT